MHDPTCPFCTLPPARILWANARCFTFPDVTPGHALIVPKRHNPTWFDASDAEKAALCGAPPTPTRPSSTLSTPPTATTSAGPPARPAPAPPRHPRFTGAPPRRRPRRHPAKQDMP